MLVQQGIQTGLGGNALPNGVITNQRGGADDHIDCHKYHQAPGQNGTAAAGQLSIKRSNGGNSTLNHATAASPQKKQYSRLIRPPRLNGRAL